MSNIDDSTLDDLLKDELPSGEKDMGVMLVNKKDRSLKFAFVGIGQAGSRIAAECFELGYSAVAINTALQDLHHIKLPERKKLFMDLGISGAGKDLQRGESAIIHYKDEISNFLSTELVEDSDMLFCVISGGGGTGSGSIQPMIDILTQFNRPLGVIFILPLHTDDAIAKKNSLTTLAKLAKLSKTNVISSLIIVDNSKIETLLGNLPQTKFWEIANKSIVKPIHLFNVLTNEASQFTSLDSSDFGKIITTGDISLIGTFTVKDYQDETALAEATMKSFASNMLANGFDLGQARCGGVILVGRKEVLDKISANAINYLYHMVSEQTNAASIYRGVYAMDIEEDGVQVLSWLSGLGLPIERINVLKEEAAAQTIKAEAKEKTRNMSMGLDLGEQTTTAAQEITKKIQEKNNAFNKLAGNNRVGLIDKRKK